MIEALSLLWWIVTAPLRAVQWAARLYVELCFLWAIAVTEVALYAICLTEAVCYKPFDRNTHDRKVLEAAACLERLDAAWAVFWRELEGPTQSERGSKAHPNGYVTAHFSNRQDTLLLEAFDLIVLLGVVDCR